MGDSTSVSASLDGKIFLEGKKCQESNISDRDDIGDGGKIVGRAIGACSGGIAIGNKMLKAFPLSVMSSHCQTTFPLLVKTRGNLYNGNSEYNSTSHNEHYALWEVIEFGNSYEAPQDDAATGSVTKNKSGNEEVNIASIPTASTQVSPASANVAAASISLDTACACIASQSNGSQIKYEDINQIDDDDIEEMDIKEPKSQDKCRRENYIQGSKKEEQAPKALMVIDGVGWDWSYMANEEEDHALVADQEAPIEFALMAKSSSDNEVFDNSLCSKACKKNTYSLNAKINELSEKLSDTKTTLYHYKLGLSQVEARLVEFKNQEIKLCEKIRGLEFKVESKSNRIKSLSNELEMLKKEKEGLDSKLIGLQSASKDLDTFLGSQRSDKNKEGLGYSTIPPPPAQVYSPPKRDIESSVSENGESSESIMSKPMIKFLKAADSPTVIKTNKDETIRKPSVKYAEMYRKNSKSSNVRGNQRNWKNLKSQQLGKNFLMKNKACLNCGDFDHLSYDCGKWVEKGKSRPKNNTHKSIPPRTIFHKSNRTPMRTNRPNMNAAQPKRTSFYKLAHSYLKRPFQRRSAVRSQFQVLRVPTVTQKFPIGNTKFPTRNSKLSTANQGNKGKANKIDDKGYWDSGCSRNMTGNISYLYIMSLLMEDMCHLVKEDARLLASVDESMLWHKRLGHLNFKTMNMLVRHNLVKGLPSKCFDNDHTCVAYLKGKQHKASYLTCLVAKASVDESVLWHKRLGHLNFKTMNRFNWTFFLKTKDETSGILRNFITEIENLKDLKVKIIRCDNRGEFRNKEMNDLCSKKRIKREFSNARTPQQNRVAKRRNRILIEVARTMLTDAKLLVTFWAKASNIDCYVQGLDYLEKFKAKGDEGTTSTNFLGTKDVASQDVKIDVSFLRYIALPNWFHVAHLESSSSNAQDACKADAPGSSGNSNPTATSTNPPADQIETLTVETPISTVSSPVPTACLNNSPQLSSDSRLISKRVTSQDDTPSLDNILTLRNRFEDILGVTTHTGDTNGVEWKITSQLVLLLPSESIRTIQQEEPKKISDALKDPRVKPIGTKWVLKNKKDERGIVIRNKARLVAQGHTQEKGINYEEDPEFPARVYKVEKAMYELHQAPKAWYDKYDGDILKKFGYSDVRSMIGSLMYLTASRPDIIFAVCACARHQVTPKECHLHVVKRIFRYVKGHPKLGLWYPKESPFDLVAYLDSDYGGATQDRKSTTEGC
nr:hypothetical protein [Tanacetum cinerariifolium]